MNRRRALFALGGTLSFVAGRRALRGPSEKIAVRIWSTEGAASYPTSEIRAAQYVRRVLEAAGRRPEVSFGERPLRFEAAERAVERRAWPKRVVEGVVGSAPLDPVEGVNVLLTDGNVTGETAGYAFDHVAAVPGAELLARAPPAEESPPVVDYTAPAAVAHLLIHELGHALGLDHGHGSVSVTDSTVTATPMVSGYAWDSADSADARRRRLAMRFSRGAERVIRSYRGGLLP